MSDKDLEKYYQKGGTYVIPVEIMNQIIGEKGELIKYLEDKIKECKNNFSINKTLKQIEINTVVRNVYQDILEKLRSGKYDS